MKFCVFLSKGLLNIKFLGVFIEGALEMKNLWIFVKWCMKDEIFAGFINMCIEVLLHGNEILSRLVPRKVWEMKLLLVFAKGAQQMNFCKFLL